MSTRPLVSICLLALSGFGQGSVVNFTPQAQVENPSGGEPGLFTQAGVTDGVAWNLNVTGNSFSSAPWVTNSPSGAAPTEISWYTQYYIEPVDGPVTVTFTFTFSEPVMDLNFKLRNFGSRVINYPDASSGKTDFSQGSQTMSISAQNGGAPVAIDNYTAGGLIDVDNSGATMVATALIQDTQGQQQPSDPASLALRRMSLGFNNPVDSFTVSLDQTALTDALAGNRTRLYDITFTPVPEPTTTALLGSIGAFLLLVRRRHS